MNSSINNSPRDIKLYSIGTINIATLFGGPLAAGVLIRRNYINLGKIDQSKNSLILAIVAIVLLYAGLFSLSEGQIEKIPTAAIPGIITLLVYAMVKRYQGLDLKRHEEESGELYTGWRGFGIGLLCMIPTFAIIVLFATVSIGFDIDKYNEGIEEFQINEQLALEIFPFTETQTPMELSEFLLNVGIPAWERNIIILEEMDGIEGLYPELEDQISTLRVYSNLRIESFRLIERAVTQNTQIYNSQINEINLRIDEILGGI